METHTFLFCKRKLEVKCVDARHEGRVKGTKTIVNKANCIDRTFSSGSFKIHPKRIFTVILFIYILFDLSRAVI